MHQLFEQLFLLCSKFFKTSLAKMDTELKQIHSPHLFQYNRYHYFYLPYTTFYHPVLKTVDILQQWISENLTASWKAISGTQ